MFPGPAATVTAGDDTSDGRSLRRYLIVDVKSLRIGH